jgi:hypothetical protein
LQEQLDSRDGFCDECAQTGRVLERVSADPKNTRRVCVECWECAKDELNKLRTFLPAENIPQSLLDGWVERWGTRPPEPEYAPKKGYRTVGRLLPEYGGPYRSTQEKL